MIIKRKHKFIISIILFSISCKQTVKNNTETTVQELYPNGSKNYNNITHNTYNFDLEDTIKIDDKLDIPDSYYNKRTVRLFINSYKNNEIQKALINNNILNIAVYTIEMSSFCFNINKNMSYNFNYSHSQCSQFDATTVIGNRLILNKRIFKVGDTIKGKFYFGTVQTYAPDSTKMRFIYSDSCMFKYKIEQFKNYKKNICQ